MNPHGNIIYFEGTVENITDRKHLESGLISIFRA
jgi:hypothetical protein